MNQMQRFLVEDHILGLEREAERLRAERERDRTATATARTAEPATPLVASAAFAVVPVTIDPEPSARVRLGRWLVGVGSAIAGTDQDSFTSAATSTSVVASKAANGPCDDGPTTLSHAA